jgi:BirA family biotin operon repressor/biotin-[acetyl-CoA-carboxylase] ligase
MTAAEALRLPQGFDLIVLDSVGSTNDVARDHARAGAPAFTTIWAHEQRGGRGRMGRSWASPRGNLYVSFVLRPGMPPATAAQASFVAAVALADATTRFLPSDRRVELKWPNDVLIEGAKLSGILLESDGVDERGHVQALILGIGVNLASRPAQTSYPATCLAELGVGDVTPGRLLEALAHALAHWHAVWIRDGFGPLRQAWLGRTRARGEAIVVRLPGGERRGIFVDLDMGGCLILEEDGARHAIAAGDVFFAVSA